ncbi:MAG: lipopolysaccharide kinase InaA family protein [Zoogloeaceae bacterium]|nr:lipopolysaccharide kinase InaA family protein [Zoogloeaceae bacterium]
MKDDFIAANDRPLLEQAGLADFDALWRLELTPVDHPNVDRGGWSSVCQLELPEQRYYLKRQSNHLTRSLRHPFGEPTFCREFRNIQRYAARGVPATQAAFFGVREREGKPCAVLLTRALTDWRDLASWLNVWPQCTESDRQQLLVACGLLARRLHLAGLIHCCFYPRHIFVRVGEQGGFEACLIDLEKTRRLWFPRRDRIKDLEQFIRHAPQLDDDEAGLFLATCLDAPQQGAEVAQWRQWLQTRRQRKEGH